ncbi:MAG: aminoglycoside phosphotransferase family protein [Alphaproteobacteria bacterium]|nr:aminoglycoside phosphotransferase family protein [Alphaproteobacteria bacterium]
MVYMMRKQEEKAFCDFLEREVFFNKPAYFKQFRGGEFSYDFFVKVNDENLVVKVLKNPYKLNKTTAFLKEHIQDVPVLAGVKYDRVFKYGKADGTIQKNYGRPLRRRQISFAQMRDIFAAYGAFSALKAPAEREVLLDENFVLAQRLKERLAEQDSFKNRLCLHFLEQIDFQTLYYDKKRLCLIHGDFFNNQILFQEGKLSAFIDWDDVRLGYRTEDFWHFLHYNLDKIPFFFLRRFWQKKLTKQILLLTYERIEDWETALNIMLLKRLCKLYEKFSFGRLRRFLILKKLSADVLFDLKTGFSEDVSYQKSFFFERMQAFWFKRIK